MYLVRHGETEWSRTGQHTGVTDLPLTPHGEEQARTAGTALLPQQRFRLVLVSPRQRARRTAELAGFAGRFQVDQDLAEWDYGGYEGLTRAEIVARRGEEQAGQDWNLWQDGVIPGETPGESAAEVRERVTRVIGRVRPVVAGGEDVALFAHGHILRALAVLWLGLPIIEGRRLALGTATIGILGQEHGNDALLQWNAPASPLRPPVTG